MTINANGTYSYTPAANYNGPDSFTYTVSDGIATVEYTVSVTVTAVNDTPIANPVTATTNEDTALTIGAAGGVLASASDPDGDPLSVATFTIGGTAYNAGQTAAGAWGSLTLNANGSYSYVPAANFNGAVPQVGFTVSDGTATASSTLTINVTPVNDAPGSTPIASQAGTDAQAVSFDISGNFFDVDIGDTRSYAATGLPPGLTLNPATGVISGTIDRSASLGSPYTVTITATDAGGLSTSRSFTWTVGNPAPIARDDALATTENASIGGSVFANNGNGADNDPDGDPLAVSAVNGVAGAVGAVVAGSNGGSFTINADGTYSFVPGTAFDNLAAGQTRATSVTYTVSDGQGGTATATVTVTVTGENDAPVAVSDSFTTAEDTPVTFDPRSNDSDIDGNALTITQINGAAISVGVPVTVTGGTVTLNANGSLTFAPAANYNGAPNFTYTISDGTTTATATIDGTVTPVNDAPVAVDDTFTTAEDTPVTFDPRSNDSDIDGNALAITQINGTNIASGGTIAIQGGTITLNPDGTLSFTPATNYNGPIGFSYTLSDGAGGTASAAVSGTVTPVNDPPVAINDVVELAEDGSATFDPRANDGDVEGSPLAIIQIDGAVITAGVPLAVAEGSVTLNADGTLTFVPNANFNGVTTFTYTISDGQGGVATATVTVTVAGENDAPIASGGSLTTNEDTAFTGTLPAATDDDGDRVVYSTGTTVPAHGTVTIAPDGSYTYTPAANFAGTDSFSFIVSDGLGGSNEYDVTVTVLPVNDPPAAGAIPALNRAEGTAVSLNLAGYFSDIEGDALSYSAGGTLPPGLALDPATGLISGSILPNAAG
ncbi:Ig-like domain-containing protein, partial [Bosea sp. CER48]|uniref:Ig-like domain-containing protein n=1 Tax=Bosea sp. CER48 TaxID=3377035 RepID=UPI0038287A7F